MNVAADVVVDVRDDFSPAQIALARSEAAKRGIPVVQHMEEIAGLSSGEFLAALGAVLHYPVLGMADFNGLTPAFDLLPFAEAAQRECILFQNGEQRHMLAFCDPFCSSLRAWAEERIDAPFMWGLAHRSDILAYLARMEEAMRAMDAVLSPVGEGGSGAGGSENISIQTISANTSPVVKLVHSTLYDALRADASDIHLETRHAALAIKYRIDGVLVSIATMQGLDFAEQAISRIKVMAELDIAERRIPQDGRFKVRAQGREIDIRVSIMPSIHGEDAVLRILDKRHLSGQMRGLTIDRLGFDIDSIASIRHLSNKPYGMLLVTGPTGSGKTTTLYAAISEINHGRDKIVTIEDPVEYELDGVLQIPVNEKKGLTFARGLRSILRHDPDKIMVGEIRDPETAQIAVQAALTGHLVFTTVHANNVFDAIGRFTHMGVDPYSFVSALNGILAQRLVRVNCQACAKDDHPLENLLKESGIAPCQAEQFNFREGKGCGQCRGTGYKGRRAIAELLILSDEVREMIVTREPIRRIKESARANGTRFLRESALDLVRQGVTTLSEINRVTLVT